LIREGEPRLLLESALLGVVGALGAQLFTWMLHLCNRFFLYGLAGYIPPGIEGTLFTRPLEHTVCGLSLRSQRLGAYFPEC
jgi:hypothetical protein